MIVQQAGNTPISYDIEVYVEISCYLTPSKTYNQEGDQRKILVTHTFDSWAPIRSLPVLQLRGRTSILSIDIFYKTVYVVPKPKIQLITDDPVHLWITYC